MRLTDAKGLDDGSEYTPDGKYIYFTNRFICESCLLPAASRK